MACFGIEKCISSEAATKVLRFESNRRGATFHQVPVRSSRFDFEIAANARRLRNPSSSLELRKDVTAVRDDISTRLS
jgi:hypothetical protein